jgi:predicted outer membrane protein
MATRIVRGALGASALLLALAAQAQEVKENSAKPGNSSDWNNPAAAQQAPQVPSRTAASQGAGTAATTSSMNQTQAGMQTGSSASGATEAGTPQSNSPSPTAGAGMAAQAGRSSAGASAAASGKMSVNRSDQQAIIDMAMANMAEVEMGKAVVAKSSNDDVKRFAQQMVDDHGQALTEVQNLAQAKGVTLPGSLDAKHNAELAKLQGMSGAALDKAYMAKGGVQDHRAVHAKLMSIEKKAKDPDVKALAGKMLPVVEQHLKHAEQMSGAKAKMPPDVGSATEHAQGKPTH